MIVYSKKIIQFIEEIKQTVKYILMKEISLKVYAERFYDRLKTASYPIKIVIFNNKSMLGYFDSNFYELGFHECLMHARKEQLHDVIRHELAHYMIFITYGGMLQPHGAEFKEFCLSMGWDEKVYRATICLEEGKNNASIAENGILRKVQKLMALATSNNKNEAEQAMIKSQQLLLKYNIESKYIDAKEEEKVVLKRILKQKKKDGKMQAIANILATFFVSTVYSRAGDFTFLEILGDRVNIEIAEYVANFLDFELDKLWCQVQRNVNLKGATAKNSFFLGLAKGYCNKINALKREHSKEVANALMVIEKKLVDARAMAYQRLTSSKSSANYCSESANLGEQMGRYLNINPAINRSQNSEALLAYSD